MPDLNIDNSNNSKLFLELIPCSRCGNAFMRSPGKDENICENCRKLEIRKKSLEKEIFDVQHKIEDKIIDLKTELSHQDEKYNKQYFVDRIKFGSNALKKSIELLKKIEETNDEKYIEEYQKLFEKIKNDYL
ncbi:MAG: hypothetical protein KGD63_14350 [Candidatus Lokiarchaeota archaeon]|nr:hypothetical protein [Candidatus Lokiarchaeota archaeon]